MKKFLTGSVTFQVENGNYILLNKIRIYCPRNINIDSKNNLHFIVPLLHSNKIKKILSKEKYTCTENKNVFKVLNFFYTRIVLTVTAVICLCCFIILDNFIFSIKVQGVEGEQMQQILSYIQSQNIKTLTLKSTEKANEVALKICQEFDFAAHANACLLGSSLVFNIYKVETPNDSGKNLDIIATHDAVITSIVVVSGTPQITVGDVVKKGDILIKGEYQISETETKPCRAVGEIRADVKFSQSTVLFDTVQILTPTGTQKTITDVFCQQFGNRKRTKNIGYEYYESTEERTTFTLFLKFVHVKTTYKELELKIQKVDLNTHKEIIADQLLAQIIKENNIQIYDKVDNFFSILTPTSTAIEVVVTINVCFN